MSKFSLVMHMGEVTELNRICNNLLESHNKSVPATSNRGDDWYFIEQSVEWSNQLDVKINVKILSTMLVSLRNLKINEQAMILNQSILKQPNVQRVLRTMFKQNPSLERDFYLLKLASKFVEFKARAAINPTKYADAYERTYTLHKTLIKILNGLEADQIKKDSATKDWNNAIELAEPLRQYRGMLSILEHLLAWLPFFYNTQSKAIVDNLKLGSVVVSTVGQGPVAIAETKHRFTDTDTELKQSALIGKLKLLSAEQLDEYKAAWIEHIRAATKLNIRFFKTDDDRRLNKLTEVVMKCLDTKSQHQR